MNEPNQLDDFDEDLDEEGRLSDGSDKDIFGNRLDGEDSKVTDRGWR